MTSKSYRARVVVLKKTKLGEKDLIITMLDESGALLQAVAKGARRPGGSFAARLELFSVVDGWFVEGRSLDVITDARFPEGYRPHAFGLEQAACASTIAELLCAVAQEGLAYPRLFDMTTLAFSSIAQAEPACALAICAADLMKTIAMAGFRPSLDACVACGRALDLANASADGGIGSGVVRVSVAEGGALCGTCGAPADAVRIDAAVLAWAQALLRSTFAEVKAMNMEVNTAFSVLQFIRQWTTAHVGRNLRSLDYLFTSGLY